jgi:hypothetical protein
MATKAVPAVSQAALQSIQDPQVRQVLRAITDGLAVRNGDLGDGQEAFLTLGDLTKSGYTATAVASALATQLGNSVKQPGTPMFDLADQLVKGILGLPEWQALFTRVSLLDAPDDTPGSLANGLLREALTRGAGISDVQAKIQTESESRAEDVKTITAALNGNAAAIQEESRARVADGVATAERITTLAASVGDNAAAIKEETRVRVADGAATAEQINTMAVNTGKSIAGIQTSLTTKTNSDNALAEAVNTLWASVGTNGALVKSGDQIVVNNVGSVATKFDQLQATVINPVSGLVDKYATLRQDYTVTNSKVDGMKGTWSIKLDLNGYVSGMSLNAVSDPSGNQRSNVLFNVDTFAVGAPGHPEKVPFAIDATTGLVSIKGDLVADGSITGRQLAAVSIDRSKLALKVIGGAQIDDAAVDTLKIAGNSVTTGTYSEGGGNYVGAGGSTTVCTASVPLDGSYNSGLIVNGVVSLWSPQNATYGIRIRINGVVSGDQRGSLQAGYPVLVPCSGFSRWAVGNTFVTLEVYNPSTPSSDPGANKPINVNSSTMSIFGGKR